MFMHSSLKEKKNVAYDLKHCDVNIYLWNKTPPNDLYIINSTPCFEYIYYSTIFLLQIWA